MTGLVLVYALNTWLPELMKRAGFSTQGSLAFLLVLNGGAVVGALIGSRIADRLGPKPVVAGSFLIGGVAIALLTLSLPIGLLLFVTIVGLGTSGTQTLIYGFVANYFRTNVRRAAVAWCAGFGRLGGVGGPLLGGLLVAVCHRLCSASQRARNVRRIRRQNGCSGRSRPQSRLVTTPRPGGRGLRCGGRTSPPGMPCATRTRRRTALARRRSSRPLRLSGW